MSSDIGELSVEEMLNSLIAYLVTQPVEMRREVVKDVMQSLTHSNNIIGMAVAKQLEHKLVAAQIISRE